MKTKLFSLLPITILVFSNLSAQQLPSTTWDVRTIAGWEDDNNTIDGRGVKSHFTWQVYNSAFDENDNLYVIDQTCIRKLDTDTNITTLFGMGAMDSDRNMLNIQESPGKNGICVDKEGNVYVSNDNTHAIYRITPDKKVEVFAGEEGYKGKGDGNRLEAGFYGPSALCMDKAGNMYVADSYNGLVRKISLDGKVTTLAGNGQTGDFKPGSGKDAQFGQMKAIAVDSKGNVYIEQNGGRSSCVAKISPNGVVSNFVGDSEEVLQSGVSPDGTGKSARFMRINALAVDKEDNLIIGERTRIRKVTPSGVVTTLAGNETDTWRDGPGNKAMFSVIGGLSIDSKGNIFVSDQYCIRKMSKL